MAEIQTSHLCYFSLHLQQATGIQQLIGLNMMSEIKEQLELFVLARVFTGASSKTQSALQRFRL